MKADTVDDVWSVIDGIAMFKMSESGASDLQEWADGALCEGAGADADAYAYALYKLGKADVTAYKEALRKYLDENTVRSATTRLKYALCLCMDGQADVSDGGGVTPADEEYISQAVEDSVGKLGVMSLAYGLHLAGNGHEGAEYPVGRILDELMNLRHEDGGWSVMGQYSDVDVTAMVLQSLAVIKDRLNGSGSKEELSGIPGDGTDGGADSGVKPGGSERIGDTTYLEELSAIEDGIETGLFFLSGKQNETGDFAGFGSDNAESTAQVLIALSSLDIDGAKDPRFVKNGHSVIDGILRYRRSDGSFAHTPDGDSNPTATSQVFTAMASYVCYTEGGIFYLVNRTSLKREVAIKAEERQAELKSGDDLESLASKQSNSLSPEQEDDSTDTDSQISSKSISNSDSQMNSGAGTVVPTEGVKNTK
ncbi:MAG: terpene cyclase/mutase family protein, partial [Lachnospiraceae bacterium]|nr:terpene cyclase/mutase family protein [Lachnospiraceae bacterium]